jgi:hypothetical protein
MSIYWARKFIEKYLGFAEVFDDDLMEVVSLKKALRQAIGES